MTDAPFYDRDGITIYNGDWRDVVGYFRGDIAPRSC